MKKYDDKKALESRALFRQRIKERHDLRRLQGRPPYPNLQTVKRSHVQG